MAIPLVVGFFTVPIILQELGIERFGVLTLVWAVVGLSSLLDFGVSRALTKRIAELHRQSARLRFVARTGLEFIALLAIGIGLISLPLIAQFDFERFKLSQDEFENSSFLLALSISIVIVGSGFRGILEGVQKFGVTSFVRLGFGLTTFIAPLFVLGSIPRIDHIIGIILVARAVGTLIMAFSCSTYLLKVRGSHVRSWIELRQMMVTGGWMTLSNIASALMLYIDRFFIAGSTFAPRLALYTTPYEVVTKLFIIPSALSSVLFPQIASTELQSNARAKLLTMVSAAILASITPLIALIMLFAEEILGWWVSLEFADDSSLVLRILSIGVLVNCSAQIFQIYLLGWGRAAWIAWAHCVELCVFLPIFYFMIKFFGLEGAAWSWTARVVIDSIAMAFMLSCLSLSSKRHWWIVFASILVTLVFFFCSSLEVSSKLVLLVGVFVSCAYFVFWYLSNMRNEFISEKS